MSVRDLSGFKEDLVESHLRARLRIPENIAKNCAFCNSEDLVLEGTELKGEPARNTTGPSVKGEPAFNVRCTDCNAVGPSVRGFCVSDGMLQAIAAWNERV